MRLRAQSPRDDRPTPPELPDRDLDDGESFSYRFGNIADYTVGHRVGRGKYGNVFQGRHQINNTCVIKV
jgi:hypothetical protein